MKSFECMYNQTAFKKRINKLLQQNKTKTNIVFFISKQSRAEIKIEKKNNNKQLK
jgi:hypothetical protein